MSRTAGKMTNTVEQDQTAPKEQCDLGLLCLLKNFCSNIQEHDGVTLT